MRVAERLPARAVASLLVCAALAGADAGLAEGARIATAARAAALERALDDAAFLAAAGRLREAHETLAGALAAAGDAAEPAQRLAAADRLADLGRLLSRAREDEDKGGRELAAAIAQRRPGDERAAEADLRAQRLSRIRDLQQRELVELALAEARTLLRDLPADAEAEALFRDLLEASHQRRRATTEQRERELRAEVALRIEQSLIPEVGDGAPAYPRGWTGRRAEASTDSALALADRDPGWLLALRERLTQRVSVQFDATPAADALTTLARITGLNVVIAPEILAATGVPVTLRVRDMPAGDLLTWIAEQAGTRWTLTGEAVYVGNAVQEPAATRIHDVAMLLLATEDFPGPRFGFASGGGTAGGFAPPATPVTSALTPDDIAALIKRTVSPATWQDANLGIVVRGQSLLVTAPDSIHRLIREFLRAQAAQQVLSVRVAMRWLELSDRYVEEIGVQWRSGAGNLITPPGLLGNGAARTTGTWHTTGTVVNNLPATAMSVIPATAGTGLTLQTAVLRGTRLSAVLSAVERNAQGRVLESPEVTALNGRQAYAFFGTQQAYIADYDGEWDPQISTLSLGATVEVRPIVSADRKYVTMDVNTAIASAILYREIISAAVDLDDGEGVYLVVQGFPIELPNIHLQTVATTVTIPDRGGMLIGGFNASLDQFAATRVPLLGSIPFLGRLFGARGRYADRRTMYLLSTVTIINYPELEARL